MFRAKYRVPVDDEKIEVSSEWVDGKETAEKVAEKASNSMALIHCVVEAQGPVETTVYD